MNRIIILLLAAIVASSCATQEKKRYRAVSYFQTHPEELAKICSDKFPVKIEYLPGKTTVKTDTTTVTDTVTVAADCPDGTKVAISCPPNKVITIRDSIFKTDTLIQENTAKIKVITGELDQVKDSLRTTTDKLIDTADESKSRLYWSLAGWGFLIFGAAVWIRKIFF